MIMKIYTPPESDVEMILEWLADLHDRTARYYTEDMQALLDTVRKPLQHVTREDVAHAISTNPGVARRRLSALRSFFNFAVAHQYITHNVAKDVAHVKREQRRPEHALSEADMEHLLQQATGETRCLIALIYYCAVTASELAAMRWSEIEIRDGKMILTIKEPHLRQVILPPDVSTELNQLHRQSDVVFPSRIGGVPLNPHSVRRRVRMFGRSIGFPDVTPQTLRTSHAHHAIARGASLIQVQKSMGHTSSRSTTR